MTDIVERLVTLAACAPIGSRDKAVTLAAADAIEERDAEIVRLRALITEWVEASGAVSVAWPGPPSADDQHRLNESRVALRKEAGR